MENIKSRYLSGVISWLHFKAKSSFQQEEGKEELTALFDLS
jgi:hypothetical protein